MVEVASKWFGFVTTPDGWRGDGGGGGGGGGGGRGGVKVPVGDGVEFVKQLATAAECTSIITHVVTTSISVVN